MALSKNDLLDISFEKIEKIRSGISCLKEIVYLNSGWTGPMSKFAINAICNSLQNQQLLGPSTKDALKAYVREIGEARSQIASFFSTKEENICLTPNTTLGINLALNAYNWGANDEIITTRHEHASALIPLYNLKDRFKTKIKLIDIDFSNPLKSFLENISKNTKAAVFSHVFWSNGFVLPIQEIISELRKKKIISIIDGAQAAGALKVNLDEINPDFYSAPGHKWLLGPHGTGFFYVNKNLFNKRPPWPSIVGYESALGKGDDDIYDLNGNWTPKKNAALFEFGGLNCSLFLGLSSAVTFAKNNLKEFDIYKRIYELSEYLIHKLNENLDIEVVTTKDHAGLVSFQHKKIPSSEIVSKLWLKNKILIREIKNFNYCRVSIHYFNTMEEIDLLVEQVRMP